MASYKKLFLTFFKIGLMTVGGGYAMIPVMQRKIVEDYGWLNKEEFLNALSLSQSSPGAIAINASVHIGYKMKGIRGALVSAIGTSLPSFLIIILVSLFFFNLRELEQVENAFKGVRAAVVAMILLSFIQLLKTAKLSKLGYCGLGLGIMFLVAFKVNPAWLLLVGGIFSIIYFNLKGES